MLISILGCQNKFYFFLNENYSPIWLLWKQLVFYSTREESYYPRHTTLVEKFPISCCFRVGWGWIDLWKFIENFQQCSSFSCFHNQTIMYTFSTPLQPTQAEEGMGHLSMYIYYPWLHSSCHFVSVFGWRGAEVWGPQSTCSNLIRSK